MAVPKGAARLLGWFSKGHGGILNFPDGREGDGPETKEITRKRGQMAGKGVSRRRTRKISAGLTIFWPNLLKRQSRTSLVGHELL